MAQKNTKIAKRYARAFVRALAEQFGAASGGAELREGSELVVQIVNCIGEDQNLTFFFKDPTVQIEVKQKVLSDLIDKVAAGVASASLVKSFFAAILKNGRAECLSDIGRVLPYEVRSHLGIVPVTVTTARALSVQERESVTKVISNASSEKHEFHWQEDENVLGGIIIESLGRRYDASTLGRLEAIRKEVSLG